MFQKYSDEEVNDNDHYLCNSHSDSANTKLHQLENIKSSIFSK